MMISSSDLYLLLYLGQSSELKQPTLFSWFDKLTINTVTLAFCLLYTLRMLMTVTVAFTSL